MNSARPSAAVPVNQRTWRDESPYRTWEAARGGGERGFMKREISVALAVCIGRIISPGSGAKLAAGSTNATGINAGCDGSWQHDIEHGVIEIPPISWSQCIPAECSAPCCSGVCCFCLLWWCAGILQYPPAQQSAPAASITAPASGAYINATASKHIHAAVNRERFCRCTLMREPQPRPIVLQIDGPESQLFLKIRPFPLAPDPVLSFNRTIVSHAFPSA